MRWLMTGLLLILVAAGTTWLLVEDRVRTAIGRAKPTIESGSETLRKLQSLRAEDLREVKLTPPGHTPLKLTRKADGGWTQDGNWPLRETEVSALLSTLTTLRTRFAAIPLDADNPDLAGYGLDQPATRVEVVADLQTARGPETLRLTFGQPTDVASALNRPCYLRLDTQAEVIRLGPDVFPMLARAPEVYRRRLLLPDADRVKFASDSGPATATAGRLPLLGDGFTGLIIERRGENPIRYSLTRMAPTPKPKRELDRPTAEPSLTADALAQVWKLDFSSSAMPPLASVAISDRINPNQLKTILTTLPDLWVERFFPEGQVSLAEAGLEQPERTLSLNRAQGDHLVVLIGREIRTKTRTEEPPPPPMFGAPPPPPKITVETYHYAKLKDNDLLFELRTDKLSGVFVDPSELRDAQLARFPSQDVVELTIERKGQPPINLKRKRGDKNATKPEDQQDRWYVGDLLADATKVSELLDPLSRLEAKGPERVLDGLSAEQLKARELIEPNTRVRVHLQPEVAPGEVPPAVTTLTYEVGQADETKKQVNVRVGGWDRVNLVEDSFLKEVVRPALAYRSRRLYDTTELTLQALTVQRDGAAHFALEQKPKMPLGSGSTWNVTKPLSLEADESKATELTSAFSQLEVAEYVEENPKPEDLDKKYGLSKPRFVVEARFTGPNATPALLEIGGEREGQAEVYAKLPGRASVFTIKKEFVDSLEAGAKTLLPLEFWNVPSDKITALEVERLAVNESYKLTQAGPDWKLSGPFDATANFADVQPLLGAAATLRADSFDALAVDPVKHGLDKPALKVKVTYKQAKPGKDDQPPAEEVVTKTILVGLPTSPEASTRFAQLEGSSNPAVFIITDALVKEADKPALARLDKVLLSIDATQVAKVQIVGAQAEQNITLAKSDPTGNWQAEGAAFPIDRITLDGLLFSSSRPPVQRLVAYGDKINWADFGLDKPTHTITLTLGGEKPSTHVVSLGKVEANGERYVRVGDKQAVGVLPPRTGELLARGKLDFVDRNLLSFDPATVQRLTRQQGKAELELLKDGSTWEITKPAKQKADQAGLGELIEELSRLRASTVAAFAPPEAELDAKYGLKNPAATITLQIDDKESRTLKIGKPVVANQPNAERYIRVEGPNAAIIGTVNSDLANQLLGDPVKFRDRFLAKFVDADKIIMTRGERTVTFAKVNGTWKLTAPLMADAEQAELDELVAALANLRLDELIAEKPADLKPFGLATPEVKWQLFAGDKLQLDLQIGSTDKSSNRVHARLNQGELVGFLEPSLSSQVTAEYRQRTVFPELDAAQVEGVIISGAFNMALQKAPNGTWTDTAKPMDRFKTGAITDLLAALGSLKVERFVADDKAKLGLYGLEKPSQVIVLTTKGQPSRTLQLGNKVGGTNGKQVYAKLPNQDAVFILSEVDTEKLTRDRASYLGK